jgi:hypothetical protein
MPDPTTHTHAFSSDLPAFAQDKVSPGYPGGQSHSGMNTFLATHTFNPQCRIFMKGSAPYQVGL